MCTGPKNTVYVERIEAITLFVHPLEAVIKRFKYEGKSGWAKIFARLLLGHLETSWEPASVDLIVANPSGPDRTHTQDVLKSARVQDLLGKWPFDDDADPAFHKPTDTMQSAGKSIGEKQEAATQHAEALRLRHPERIKGKRVVVYDDICTTGLQLNAVARKMRDWGAESVCGIVLARQPWGDA